MLVKNSLGSDIQLNKWHNVFKSIKAAVKPHSNLYNVIGCTIEHDSDIRAMDRRIEPVEALL